MSTKSEQFSAKIRNLTDYQNRILHNIAPLPTGTDIANTLRYFIHTLRSILKEAPADLTDCKQSARRRLNPRLPHYPSLDYLCLYETLDSLIEIVPNVQYGQSDLGQAIQQLFGCILWFLEPEIVDTIPHTVASTLAIFPMALQKETVDLLCTTLLPICLSEVQSIEGDTYATMSVSAVIMLVLQHCKNKAHHAQLMECIMTYKKDVFKDILCTIAFGPSSARGAASNLLFHYWPSLVPSNVEDRDFSYTCWKPILCQRSNCLSPVNNAAVKMCMDPVIAGKYSKHPPPLYLCQVCSDYVNREICDSKPFLNVLQPQENVAKTCENKNCSSSEKEALFTCYSSECTGFKGNRPIRYCQNCNNYIHTERKEHIIQDFPADPLSCDKETQSYLCEAIISLLKEAHISDKDPLMAAAEAETTTDMFSQPSENEVIDLESMDGDSRLLSRFGLWLLIEKCNPTDRTADEVVGRLLSMVFQWFGFTATLTQDSVALESLKADYVTTWLIRILKSHFNVFVSCLLPQPPDYAKVGGDYDSLCSRITELLGGLRKVFSLTPYNSVTFEVWDYIMPHWMECICNDIPDEEIPQLQDVLCRLFDVDMSPLPFSTEKLFNFVACRFRGMAANDQEKALLWLQILTETDIVIPLKLLLSIFSDGLTSMSKIQLANQRKDQHQKANLPSSNPPVNNIQRPPEEVLIEPPPTVPPSPPTELPPPPPVSLPPGGLAEEVGVIGGGIGIIGEVGGVPVELPFVTIDPSPDDGPIQEQDEEQILRCFVLMLDMLVIQCDLQFLPFHQGMENSQSKDFVSLLTQMLSMTWLEAHKCTNPRSGKFQPQQQQPKTIGPCSTCELWGIFFQLSLRILEHISPVSETKVCDMPEVSEYQFEKFLEDGLAKAKALNNDVKGKKNRMAERGSSKQKRFTKTKDPGKGFLSATEMKPVEVFTAETVKLPSAKDLKAEKEKAVKKAAAADKSTKGKKDGENGTQKEARFKVEELPKSIQLLFMLLKDVPRHNDPEVLLNLFYCIKILCLNAECLRQAAKDHDAFLKYAQNHLLIPNFWNLLEGELSCVNEIMVPLALHSLALPHGSDVMWNLLQRDVDNGDWKARFKAVERVTALLRFVEKKSLGNNSVIMCSLACAFSSLITSTEDICPAVSSRAIIMLETIPKKALKVLVGCLEFQWDCVVEDRVMILDNLYKLQHFLPETMVLSWEFFMNRLDTLALEAQVEMEHNKEFPFPIDLSRSQAGVVDRMDTFLNKQTRARVARSQSEMNSSLKPRRLSSFTLKNEFKKRSMSSPPTSTGGFSRVQFGAAMRSTYSRLLENTDYGAETAGPIAESFFEDGHLQTVQEEQAPDLSSVDLSSLDKETVHKLISLLMKFMTRESSADEEQTSSRAMNSVKGRNMMRKSTVLRHLSVLMGYKQLEKCFILAPQQLRESAVFYSFMAGAPKMLDHNVKVGTVLLPMIIELLAYCPSPQKAPQDMQLHDYTLWFLEPHCRISWLMSFLIILYKYNFDQLELKAEVKSLVRVTINTLEAQRHQCKPKRPEPPTPEDIWGATTPLEKKKSESSLIQAMNEMEDQDNSEEVSSIPSAGPSSPLLPTAPREIPAGLHQQVECEPDMLFVPEEEVTALTIKKSNLSFVASTIVEVEEENEESVEDLEPLNKVEAIPAKALMVNKEEPVVHVAQAVPRVVTEVAKVERQALEPTLMTAKVESFFSPFEKSKLQPRFRSKKQRKMGVATISSNALSQRIDNKLGGGKQGDLTLDLSATAGGVNSGIPKAGMTRKSKEKGKKRSQKLKDQSKTPEKKSSVYSAARRYHEDKNYMALTRCTDCGVLLEEYDDDTVSLAIVVLSTLVHRDPELAAPLLLEMLQVVARIANAAFFPWQSESFGSPPGHCCTVAKQFLRCTLHQLAPNGIFPQLFLSRVEDGEFWKTMVVALTDFSELTPTDAISFLLEGLNEKKTLPSLRILIVLMNLAEYMENLPLEGSSAWSNLVPLFEVFFRKIALALPENCDTNDLCRIMLVLLKSPATKLLNTLLDPMSKLMSFVIQKARFKLKLLIELCSLCNRIFMKERERQSFSRCIVMELVNALKFKSSLPDINLIQLVQFICLDAGGKMSDFGNLVGDGDISDACIAEFSSCGLAVDCMKTYLTDAIEYVGDLHTLTKVKDKMKGGSQNLNEDTLGSQLKAGVAQIIALEFTRNNQREGGKSVVNRYLPWLYHPPSAVQQGPKEFIDCIAHVRLLSWLLLGSLTHAAVCPINSSLTGIICHPIPLEAGNHIADHVQVILAGFAEQSKASVLHMSSLFHAFILCQLWTMYCEQMASISAPQSDQHTAAMMSVMDFWCRVTPGVLQLLSHSKVLADMVNLHFLSLMEALQECNSSVLTKLFPMWTSILFSYPSKLPGSLQVRLQNCENWAPPSLTKGEVTSYHSSVLLKWLKRLQFKMGQIEIQSSAAAQFYTV
ncbi:protein unc-79 homolog [Asterias rubens]|uniref:protein unc-79 homolog n=1 Tax=Asterias rubens TaxID=7604 RepID=UPI001455CEAE|nr:protein unc-79 homolog [Asterias rubens]